MKHHTIILLFALLYAAVSTHAQTDEESIWRIKGFVDTYHAMRTDEPNNLMSSRTRVRGEIGRDFGRSSLFVSFNATYNALLKARTGFELREAYLDHRGDHWGLRAGRQLVIWGAADGLRITDLVSPLDMTEFLAQDYDDIRMPVNALRLFVFNDKVRVEAIAVPAFEGYVLPVDASNPWSVLPTGSPLPVVWNDTGSRPAFHLSNFEYGGRLSVTLPGVDFSLSGLYTWNKMPVIQYAPSPTEITVSPQYYRMGFVGGDISKPLGQFVLRGEAAYNIDKHFSYKPETMRQPQQGFRSLNWLVGVDWYAPSEWMLSAQFSTENIFGYEDCIMQERNNMLATLNVSKKLFNSTLQLSDFTYFDVSNKGWFSRFAADYALSDQIHLLAGFDWFGGDKGIFSVYKNNSEVWIKAKYSF
ncbi:MAG: DUF1302 family protein [Candidatus Limimorpha sp.]